MTTTLTIGNDIDIAMGEALRQQGIDLGADDCARLVSTFLADDRFWVLMTSAVHEVVGSPLDRGDFSDGRSCSDYSLALVRHLLRR